MNYCKKTWKRLERKKLEIDRVFFFSEPRHFKCLHLASCLTLDVSILRVLLKIVSRTSRYSQPHFEICSIYCQYSAEPCEEESAKNVAPHLEVATVRENVYQLQCLLVLCTICSNIVAKSLHLSFRIIIITIATLDIVLRLDH